MLVDSGSIEVHTGIIVRLLTNLAAHDSTKIFNNVNPYMDDYNSLSQKSVMPKVMASPEKAQQYKNNKLELAEMPILKRKIKKNLEADKQAIEKIAIQNIVVLKKS